MKTYCLIVTTLLVLGSSAQAMVPQDFLSPQLFFKETLKNYNASIDLESLELSQDLNDVSDLRKNNFAAKITFENTMETPVETYKVSFSMRQDYRVTCLGTILPIDHPIMQHELAKGFQERSGRVYMSECEVSQGSEKQKFPADHAISFYNAFPKVANLPIANQDNLGRYHLLKEIKTENKMLQCVSRDINSFEVPRSAIYVNSLKNHYSIGIHIGRSDVPFLNRQQSADPGTQTENNSDSPQGGTGFNMVPDMDPDIPLNVGEQDGDSLAWVKDNINFFKSIRGDGSSFNVIFKKSDCQIVGEEDSVTIMTCGMDIAKENQVNDIQQVFFTFETQMITKPYVTPGPEQQVKILSYPEFNAKIQFVVDKQNKYHPIYKTTHYHNTLTYNNLSTSNECHFASQMPKPEKSKSKTLGVNEELI